MIFYSNGVVITDLKEGKKKDNSSWYLVKFSDSNGFLSGFTSSDLYSKLKKGSIYTLECDFRYSALTKNLQLFIKEADEYVI